MGASFTVLNNLAAINGINKLNTNNINLNNTLNRLASGKRINYAGDDAAGLQIADGLRGHYMALNQAVRNANDGIAFLQIADGALEQVTSMLHRMVTLAEQAATGTVASTNRVALQAEFGKLNEEIRRISNDTNFNGRSIFSDAKLQVFVGDISKTTSFIEITIGEIKVEANGISLNGDNGVGAQSALAALKKDLNSIAQVRGQIGATINRLQASVNVIAAQAQNTLAAESSIRDANMADEITNMTKYQIMAQTGISALAQANANAQNVLGLLR